MRKFFVIYAFSLLAIVSIAGFRGMVFEKPPIEVFPDMVRQSRYNAQSESAFFADRRTDRPAPSGVVPRQYGSADESDRIDDDYYLTGRVNGDFAGGFPMIVSREKMERGRDRYAIYCASCHGGTGDGDGITAEYGMFAPDFHEARFYEMPEGRFFDVITNGSGLMGAYKDKLSVDDRWAVVAYVRALQRARLGTGDDVPEDRKAELGL